MEASGPKPWLGTICLSMALPQPPHGARLEPWDNLLLGPSRSERPELSPVAMVTSSPELLPMTMSGSAVLQRRQSVWISVACVTTGVYENAEVQGPALFPSQESRPEPPQPWDYRPWALPPVCLGKARPTPNGRTGLTLGRVHSTNHHSLGELAPLLTWERCPSSTDWTAQLLSGLVHLISYFGTFMAFPYEKPVTCTWMFH